MIDLEDRKTDEISLSLYMGVENKEEEEQTRTDFSWQSPIWLKVQRAKHIQSLSEDLMANQVHGKDPKEGSSSSQRYPE